MKIIVFLVGWSNFFLSSEYTLGIEIEHAAKAS